MATAMKWLATAPANIALIKYMGKTDHEQNQPSNASLSYTLPNLQSYVELELSPANTMDRWEALTHPKVIPFTLADSGQQRFLKHLAFLKQQWDFTGSFIVRSGNDFPSDCGLASSASSFAALTKCAAQALAELTKQALPDTATQADLSRQGSGSSCRSFFTPWAIWDDNGARAIDLPLTELIHQVAIIAPGQKKVASSQAHRLVSSSALFPGRSERATARLTCLLDSLKQDNWQQAHEIVWQEFYDMHALFETATPPFGYMTADSLTVLNLVRDYWQQQQDGPLVTMDAGPNVHLLYRATQSTAAAEIKQQLQQRGYHVR